MEATSCISWLLCAAHCQPVAVTSWACSEGTKPGTTNSRGCKALFSGKPSIGWLASQVTLSAFVYMGLFLHIEKEIVTATVIQLNSSCRESPRAQNSPRLSYQLPFVKINVLGFYQPVWRRKLYEYHDLDWKIYLWWWKALSPRKQSEKNANASAGRDQVARAKPIHSMISPKKLAPEMYVNKPPASRRIKKSVIRTGSLWH